VPVIANVGPQNLGHRLRPGSGQDELALLGRTIDDMMDRIAVGYETQRRFAADASHELRTPLAVQRTLIEVGMARARTEDQLELLTAQLLGTNERNEQLIEGLLVLAESDRGLLSRTPLRLDLIAAEVLDAHRARTAEAGITNTGDDVPVDVVSALFEPFRRLSARIHQGGGAGLGLSIARSITRAHDGAIAASSTGHDGLRVQVSFPEAPRTRLGPPATRHSIFILLSRTSDPPSGPDAAATPRAHARRRYRPSSSGSWARPCRATCGSCATRTSSPPSGRAPRSGTSASSPSWRAP
jgi:signal transduction histidine kinase